ncbi:MAG: transposase [Pirellulaceae bacterium]|nr:transposase [Pirellulaceae bacterium]
MLVAEHLRLGTWDLLCGWTGRPTPCVEPRLALQLVHEAAVCTRGIRAERTLHERAGFELTNGLPFVATDVAMHQLLRERTVDQALALQVALGKLRRASGHFQGKLLAIDPHRVRSYSKRQMRKRAAKEGQRPLKQAQTFWVLDADTYQPLCFTTGTASRHVAAATPELMDLVEAILQPTPGQTLVVADSEHFSTDIIHDLHRRTGLDFLVPLPHQPTYDATFRALPETCFTRRWAGLATAKLPFTFKRRQEETYYQFVERFGERADEWSYQGFLSTSDREEVDALTRDFPKRWHVEEFFNAHQALGWNRAGTMNLNIRYGQMTLALIAQAVLFQLRQRLATPYCTWDANHLATDLFHALEGDVRVTDDTILVTYYNAPPGLQEHYEHLPEKLAAEHISPTVPWLYNYALDFRFC